MVNTYLILWVAKKGQSFTEELETFRMTNVRTREITEFTEFRVHIVNLHLIFKATVLDDLIRNIFHGHDFLMEQQVLWD